jgi:Fe-S cluster biogenesis protein NfuA
MNNIEITEEKILIALNEIRPYLQKDDGDVEFVSFDSDAGILFVRLTGNCAVCPISIMTLRAGIERYLIARVPEIYRIEQVKN